jgi:3-methyladenine DNA glycosylase AlkD
MSQRDLIERVRAELEAGADPDFREGVRNFFREDVNALGVRAPLVKRIAAGAYRECKGWPRAERERFAHELWKSRCLEEAAVAVVVYRRFAKEFGAREFKLFERWVDRYVTNWANCDGVASWLLASCIENEPALIQELPAWTASRNRWKRRAAVVALLQEAKLGRNVEAVLDVAGRLIEDPDDMVQKSVGWVLKEAYPKKPREVVRFLLARGTTVPRLVLRLAAEKMTAADKASVLAGKQRAEAASRGN